MFYVLINRKKIIYITTSNYFFIYFIYLIISYLYKFIIQTKINEQQSIKK